MQGVYYRESTRSEAERHGVSGWVRNLPDGTVEAVLEGAPDAVHTLMEWCKRGPPSAKVAAVDQRVEAPEGDFQFRVLQ